MNEPQIIDTTEGRWMFDWLLEHERKFPNHFESAALLIRKALADAYSEGKRQGSIRTFELMCERHEAVDNAMYDELHKESQDAQHGSQGTDAQQGGEA